MKSSDVIEAIRTDNISGAQSITSRVASIVGERIRAAGERDLRSDLLQLGPALINAQPAMASIFNLFNDLLLELDDCLARGDSPTILGGSVEAFSRALEDHNRAIALQVGRTIPEKASVFTHSNSSTLRAALEHIHEAGKQCTVFCTESRPACEGSQLARALSETGIRTCLVTDSLIFSLLQKQRRNSVVLVGADAVTTGGIINKAGTLGLAVATRSWGVPLYVLAGSEKFLPAEFFPRAPIRDEPAEEILSSAPPELRIINRYFDVTPLDCITAVISESGVVIPGDLTERLRRRSAHPNLLAVLAGEG